jgi:hypothetical protein
LIGLFSGAPTKNNRTTEQQNNRTTEQQNNMGRGTVSKTIRAQNRAGLAGNPSRGNPNAGWAKNVPTSAQKRRSKFRRDYDTLGLQKMIIHDNMYYRVSYILTDEELTINAMVRYKEARCSTDCVIIDETDPNCLIVGKKLLITLRIEEARKKQ